jgi:hypothetical protein
MAVRHRENTGAHNHTRTGVRRNTAHSLSAGATKQCRMVQEEKNNYVIDATNSQTDKACSTARMHVGWEARETPTPFGRVK